LIAAASGAAYALSVIKTTAPAFLQWEDKAQQVAGTAAALAMVTELGAPPPITALMENRLAMARQELANIELPNDFGPSAAVIDLLAELAERAHPAPPR
jgi:hypothetical protein